MTPLLLLVPTVLLAQPPAPAVVPLWDGKAPHAVGESRYDKPNLTVYPAPKDSANGAAVVICPGGGYGNLAVDHEGKQVAAFFNSLGVSAFILQYRIAQGRPGPLEPAPLKDAQRAIRLVRSKAKDYGIDTNRVGIIGFSAGGHLASTAGTHFDAGDEKATDPTDRLSCRPDFLILGYPVISMEDGVTHGGSKNNLIGRNADAKLVAEYSNEKHVTDKTPPTFLFHTNQDTGVVPENSIRFYQALKKAKVPAELHIYEKGPHGVGMNPKTGAKGTDTWGDRLADWLKTRGVLEKK